MKRYSSLDWLEILWRRRRAAASAAGAIFALILLGTVLYPPLYESSAKILIQSNRAHYVLSPALQSASDPNAPVVNDHPISEQDLNSEIELVTQLRLIEYALADLSGRGPAVGILASVLAWPPRLLGDISGWLYGAPRPTALQRRALAVQKRLGAAVIRKSNMLEVSYQSHDPAWTREFLNALLNRYFELHAQIVHDARSEQFFDTQISRLHGKLKQAEDHLRAVRERTGILSLPDQSEAIVYQLSGFEAEYRKDQSRLDGVNHQLAALEHGLKQSPTHLLKEVKTAPNPAYQTLRPKVLEMELNRDDVLDRYRPGSKTARQVTTQFNAAKTLLGHENHTEVIERLSDLSPVWLGLAANLAQARVTAAALSGSQDSLAQQIAIYRDELRRLTDHSVEVEQAQREVEADKEAYFSYLRKGEEARAEMELNESRIMNVVLAMPPSLPVVPKFPKYGLNLCAAVMLALCAGVAAAWWEERQDPTIYSAAAIAESCPEPVVAVLNCCTKGSSAQARRCAMLKEEDVSNGAQAINTGVSDHVAASAALTHAATEVGIPASAADLMDRIGIRTMAERIAAVARLVGQARVLISGCRSGDGASTVAGALALDLSLRLDIETLLVRADSASIAEFPEGKAGGNGVRPRVYPTPVARLFAARWVTIGDADHSRAVPASAQPAAPDDALEGLRQTIAGYHAAVVDVGVARLDARILAVAGPDDPVLVVVRYGCTRREELAATLAILKLAKCKIGGVILNAYESPVTDWLRRLWGSGKDGQ